MLRSLKRLIHRPSLPCRRVTGLPCPHHSHKWAVSALLGVAESPPAPSLTPAQGDGSSQRPRRGVSRVSPTQRPRQGGVGQPGPCSGRTHTRWALPGSWLGSRHLDVCRAQSPRNGTTRGRNKRIDARTSHGCTPVTELGVLGRERKDLVTLGHLLLYQTPPTAPRPQRKDHTTARSSAAPSLRGHRTRMTRVFRARSDSGVCHGPAPGCARGGPRRREGHRRHSSTVRAPSPEVLQM